MIEAEVKTQMNPIFDFKRQVALVTGAAKGMGLEGGTAICLACDVADKVRVAAMVDRADGEYGRLDTDAADESIEHFESVTAVNQRESGPA